MNKKAFTIVECIIFIMITLILLVCVNQMILYIHAQLKMHQRYCNSWLQAMTALDVLTNDVETAPCAISTWNKMEPTMIMWQQSSAKNIGWCMRNNNLVRIVGYYNEPLQKWSHKNKTVLLKDVLLINFTLYTHHNSIISVAVQLTFTCNDKRYEMNRRIMVRNRVIPCH